jgi:hypothetical protein
MDALIDDGSLMIDDLQAVVSTLAAMWRARDLPAWVDLRRTAK